MSLCDYCGGEWGHSPGCQGAAEERARSEKGSLKQALRDVIMASSLKEAKSIALKALEK